MKTEPTHARVMPARYFVLATVLLPPSLFASNADAGAIPVG
ncbi:MAG: hypothetical protein ACTHK2_01425 [Dokdonella sp.]